MFAHSPQPFRRIRLGPREVSVNRGPDGISYIRASNLLGSYPDRMTDRLDHWAATAPDRIYLAKRGEDGEWRTLGYRQARDSARAIAEALLRRRLSAERPVVILSGNDLE